MIKSPLFNVMKIIGLILLTNNSLKLSILFNPFIADIHRKKLLVGVFLIPFLRKQFVLGIRWDLSSVRKIC